MVSDPIVVNKAVTPKTDIKSRVSPQENSA